MMGTQTAPAQLFYDFDLERNVPSGHMLREIDRFLDVDGMLEARRPFNSHPGRYVTREPHEEAREFACKCRKTELLPNSWTDFRVI